MTETEKTNWFDENPRKARWLVFLICLLFVEILIRILVWAGLVSHQVYPTSREPTFWAYTDPVVGIWRYPNTSFRHVTDCVDQLYTTNSVGARDPERNLRSADERRVVVLGDSMVEGYGVARNDRLTDKLEERTGIEHLNFGTGGKFGTIQQWLYYREYASKYDHSEVFVFIFPANDYDDNDVNEFGQGIYRPFLRKTGDSYEVYYPVDFEDRDTSSRSVSDVIRNTIDNNVYVLNALNVGINALKGYIREGRPSPAHSNYDDFTEEHLDTVKFSLNGIAETAGDRPVYLFTIPEEADFQFAKQNGYRFRLVDELAHFADARSNVRYTDLLPHYLEYARNNDIEYREFTLGCNRHWGELGGRVAAQAVYDLVFTE